MSVEVPVQETRFRKLPTWAVIAITAAVMAALFVGYQVFSDSLRWKDPAGSRACSMLSDLIDSDTGKLTGTLQDITAVAEQALLAKTAGIRKTALATPGTAHVGLSAAVDYDELYAACITAGVSMPAYRDSP